MNLRQIEVFTEIMRTGSVTEAAKALHVSQPSISKTLSYAENKLGIQLFKRMNGKLVPTPEAMSLYKEAEQVIQSLDHFQDFCRDLAELKQTPLTINAEALIGQILVPHTITEYRKNWPEVRFRFEIHNSVNISNHVKWRQADLGLIHFPRDEKEVEARIIRVGRVVCVMPTDHPFAHKDYITTDDLAQTSVIYCHGGAWLKKVLKPVMPTRNGQLQVDIEVNQFANGCLLVQQNQGVMLVDDLACFGQNWTDLVFRPFEPCIELALGVIHRSHEPLSRPAELFIEQMEKTLTEFSTSTMSR